VQPQRIGLQEETLISILQEETLISILYCTVSGNNHGTDWWWQEQFAFGWTF
jgi:hypothetical protein